MSDGDWRTRIRWVVVHPDDPKVLMAHQAGVMALPQAERSGQVWTADPDEVLPVLRELLGFDAVLLRCLDEGEDPAARLQQATLMAVPRGPAPLPDGATWAGREDLAGAALQPDGDAALAARVVGELEAGHTGAARQPWAARGWLEDAERWLRSSMEAIGRTVTGPARQVRVWELSCVLRAPTAAGDVYLKANGDFPLFVNEGVVMRALAELFGDHIPDPLAVDAERGWMVLADFGDEVGWEVPVEVAEQVTRTFARLQIQAGPQIDRLLAAGCRDRRLDRLAAQAEAWLPAIEATGRLPAIDAATWLSADEMAALRAALPSLAASCAELATYAIPPSIVHGDLHLSNVANGPKGYLFFDWTDACIAHPFLDMPTIRRGTAFEEEQGDDELRERLREVYLAEWAAFEPAERLHRAWRLAIPLGALHQAISYRSIVAELQPPIDLHMAQSTAYWLRRVLAGLPGEHPLPSRPPSSRYGRPAS